MAETSAVDPFDTWFASLIEEFSDRRAELMPWFRRLYEQHGPVAMGVVETAWDLDVLEAAERGVALTLRDLSDTTSWRPEVQLNDVYGGGLAITVEGHSRGATDGDPTEGPRIVCDIADQIQEDVCENFEVWPVCSDHDVGVHARIVDGEAVWWCRLGNHAVGAIGALGA